MPVSLSIRRLARDNEHAQPLQDNRNQETCIDCKKCSRVCPSSIPVHTRQRVHSDECMACLACVEACPIYSTLGLELPRKRFALSGYRLAALIAVIFFAFIGIGMMTGNWRNGVSVHEYWERIRDIQNPIYDHNRGKGIMVQ
ncbi:MAG: 4Fe-4S dicluster domain-containing protein [Candidatus Latescibacterota bacterium]